VREITNKQIKKKGKALINKGYNGNAIVAFVDMLGFSQEIMTKWGGAIDDPLKRIMEIKGFVKLARQGKAKHTFFDYDLTKILGTAKYPDLITISDSFVFLQTIKKNKDLYFILNLLSVVGSIIELWRVSKDKGFTIRGGIDFGPIFYSKREIIGPTFINAYNIESKIADVSRIVLSDNLAKKIYKHQPTIHSTLKDYLLRYFVEDIDGKVILNPLIVFGYSDELLDEAMYDFNLMSCNIKRHSAKSKYYDLLSRLYKRDKGLSKIEIFNK